MSNRRRGEGFEDVIEFFLKEFVRKGMDGFPPNAASGSGKRPGMEDFFQMMRDMKDRAKEASRETTIVVNEDREEEAVHETSAEEQKSLEVLQYENQYLKEQLEMARQQIKDKDEIIALLKAQQKEESSAATKSRSKSTASSTKKGTTKK